MATPIRRRNISFPLLITAFLVLFLAIITFNLATTRALSRLTLYLNQLRPKYSPPSTSFPATVSLPSRRSIINASMAPDKYKNPPQAPPAFIGTKDSIIGDAKAICETTRSLLDKIVADIPADKATFTSVLAPTAEDENETQLKNRILTFYQYVSGNADLRNASTEADKILENFAIECNTREDVFQLVDAVFKAQKSKEPNLDAESLLFLEKEHKGYIRSGLGLPKGQPRDRFTEIKQRLSQISIEFSKNLNEEKGGIWLTREELDGVHSDVLDGLEKGTGENEGKLKLSFKYPDIFPTLKFAKNPETRKKVFIANENKVLNSPYLHWKAPKGAD